MSADQYGERWTAPPELALLARYATQVQPPHVIVEIGAYRGRTTVALAQASQAVVYSIDPHEPSVGDPYQFGDADRAAWTENVLTAGVAARVLPINLRSQDVARIWNRAIGLLWIDGEHSYEGVKADIAGFLPFVTGVVAFHDINGEGVAWAIAERDDLALVETVAITAVYRRVAR